MSKSNIAIFILLLICSRLFGQVDNSDKLLFEINQRILPGPNPDIMYEIKKGKITIYRIKIWDRDRLFKKKRIYRDRLNQDFIDSLIYKIDNSGINNLNKSYSGGWIDGVWWTIKLRTNKTRKEIFLDNYYLPEIGNILDLINSNLPKKHRLIRFDYFDIKSRYTNE